MSLTQSASKGAEHGEAELTAVIHVPDSTHQLYLIRVPKHVAISSLDGVTVKKYEDKCIIEELKFPMGHHVLESQPSADSSNFRALVGTADGAVRLANAFSGCLSLRRVFEVPKDTSSSPATTAYKPREKCIDLQLPRLPVGSLSTADELKARLGVSVGKSEKDSKKKSKKRKHEEEPVVVDKKEKKKKSSSKI